MGHQATPCHLQPLQHKSRQLESGQRAVLEQLIGGVTRPSAGLHQGAHQGESGRRGVAVLEPACVHADGHQKGVGGFFAQRLSESLDGLETKPAGGLRTGIDQLQSSQIVLCLMMIDDNPGG